MQTKGMCLVMVAALAALWTTLFSQGVHKEGAEVSLPSTGSDDTPAYAREAIRAFDRMLLLEEKGETSAGVNVGDLNGDGLPDIVLGKGRHWPLNSRVLLNDGKGGFIASNLGIAPHRTYSAAMADIDRDGDLDIIV